MHRNREICGGFGLAWHAGMQIFKKLLHPAEATDNHYMPANK
jgi:hypothetical protein